METAYARWPCREQDQPPNTSTRSSAGVSRNTVGTSGVLGCQPTDFCEGDEGGGGGFRAGRWPHNAARVRTGLVTGGLYEPFLDATLRSHPSMGDKTRSRAAGAAATSVSTPAPAIALRQALNAGDVSRAVAAIAAGASVNERTVGAGVTTYKVSRPHSPYLFCRLLL